MHIVFFIEVNRPSSRFRVCVSSSRPALAASWRTAGHGGLWPFSARQSTPAQAPLIGRVTKPIVDHVAVEVELAGVFRPEGTCLQIDDNECSKFQSARRGAPTLSPSSSVVSLRLSVVGCQSATTALRLARTFARSDSNVRGRFGLRRLHDLLCNCLPVSRIISGT